MFSIGASEPLPAQMLERNSVVWLGQSCGESSSGIPPEHPLCSVVLNIIEKFRFVGSWLLCRNISGLREFEKATTLLRLQRAQWVVDSTHKSMIRAHRLVTPSSPWPYPSRPGLAYRGLEVLVVGRPFEARALHCDRSKTATVVRAIEAEEVVLDEKFSQALRSNGAYAVCVGRTHTENSPGISVIGPAGLDVREFVPPGRVLAVHGGTEAERAWSYGRTS